MLIFKESINIIFNKLFAWVTIIQLYLLIVAARVHIFLSNFSK